MAAVIMARPESGMLWETEHIRPKAEPFVSISATGVPRISVAGPTLYFMISESMKRIFS